MKQMKLFSLLLSLFLLLGGPSYGSGLMAPEAPTADDGIPTPSTPTFDDKLLPPSYFTSPTGAQHPKPLTQFDREKQYVDRAAKSRTGNAKAQIKHIYMYTLRTLNRWHLLIGPEEAPKHTYIAHAFQKLLDKTYKCNESYRFLVAYGALCHLNHLLELANPDMVQTYQAAYTSGFLLSPELHSPDFSFCVDNVNIYKTALRVRQRLKRYAMTLLGLKYSEEDCLTIKKHIHSPSYYNPNTSFLSKHGLRFLILTGAGATFTYKGFFYALKNRILLYGLDSKHSDAHGGMYWLPILLTLHDGAHGMEIIRDYKIANTPSVKEYDERQVSLFTKYMVGLADQLYSLIKSNKVFKTSEEKTLAWKVAFDHIHEQPIYRLIPTICPFTHKMQSSPFSSIHNQLIQWIELRLSNSGKLQEKRQLPVGITAWDGLYIKDVSDFAQGALEVCPEREQEIYPFPGYDRTLYYDTQVVFEILCSTYKWFYDKVKWRLNKLDSTSYRKTL